MLSFLPRGVRIREVDGVLPESLADPLVAGEFSSIVCSDGLDDVLERFEEMYHHFQPKPPWHPCPC